MGSLEIEIARKVGENEVLFGSVTTADIAAALCGQGLRDRPAQAAAARTDQEARRVRRAAQAAPRRDDDDQGQGGGGRRRQNVERNTRTPKRKTRSARALFRFPFFVLRYDSVLPVMPDIAVAERTLPHNLEAERSVLGAILLHNDAFNLAAEVIDSGDFFRDAHRRIFDKMVKLAERSDAIDLVTLKEELGRVRRARRGRRPGLHHGARRRRAALDERRALRADHQGEGDAPESDLLREQDSLDGVRGRGRRRRHPRPGRARDLRDRRRQGARRLRLAARSGAVEPRHDREAAARARSWSPACRPASPISTR